MTDTALPVSTGAAAVQLRLHGTSYVDIAHTLGLRNARAALTLVTRELASQADETSEDRDTLRREAAAQLDELLVGVMDKASNPHDDEHLVAVRAAVTIIDRRIKLYGLDAPTEITVHNPTATELDQWVAAMVRHTMPAIAMDEPDIVDVDSYEG
jgi:hypothetical protein